ncbi:MAG: hypothetical protein NZM00_00400 [Anaerolinea sp.]|nr:hypothetical protein [Anaerolinea sp.]
MNTPEVEIHTAKWIDLPVLHRMSDSAIALHAELKCTLPQGEGLAVRPPLVLRRHGVYTLVGRVHRQPIAGQYRLKADDHLAQMLVLSPRLDENAPDSAWLHLIDAMTAHAGRRGAHMLTGEVDEGSRLFCTMRQAGFAVYARQELYFAPSPLSLRPADRLVGVLDDETDADAMGVQLLYANIVPRLVQPIAVPSSSSTGMVYRRDDQIMGYLALSSGRGGLYVLPFLHPDIPGREAAAVLYAAIMRMAGRGVGQPVYVCVRRYQDWLVEPLQALGMERVAEQAVMVRHIAAGVKQPAFARVPVALHIAQAITPPTSSIKFNPPIDAVEEATAYHGV